jgi:hypothetical protein
MSAPHGALAITSRRKEEFLLNRRLKIALKGLAFLIAIGLVCGIVYEKLGRKRDRARLPQIGRSVDIGGRTLNLSCSGIGGPPVVFESAGAGPGLGWEPLQAEVAKFTQACWYDRAGEGWSDPGPFPRTSAAIARDLHELLNRAGVPPPYVLRWCVLWWLEFTRIRWSLPQRSSRDGAH